MNLENFTEFIKEPSHLYRINYQELKGMVLQYPNSINLRILLLLKSKMDSHPDFEKNLREASVYAIDRARIYELLKNPGLELKQTSNVKLAPEGLEISVPSIQTEKEETDIERKPDAEIEEKEEGNKYEWLDEAVESLESASASNTLVQTTEINKEAEEPLQAFDGMFEKYLSHVAKLFSGIVRSEEINTSDNLLPFNKESTQSEETQREPEQMKNLKKLLKHKGNNQEE